MALDVSASSPATFTAKYVFNVCCDTKNDQKNMSVIAPYKYADSIP